MPVYTNLPSGRDPSRNERVLFGKSSTFIGESDSTSIDIGMVNNMPDGALQSTERQFLTLLDAAAAGLTVNVTFYSLPDVPRSDRARRHIDSFYARIDDLWDRPHDGLIVTGAEPRTAQLMDEPYWTALTEVFEWADRNTYSLICSCLAAHAAVLHMDAIGRRRLDDKRFGVFQCRHTSNHPLIAGLPSHVAMPHSRWNDLPEKELIASGYQILTHSDDAGVDSFVKQRNSLFVLFQGHPEYEANTLLLEYRRDIGRYLRGERETYPSMPQDCFDPIAAKALRALQKTAIRDRSEQLLRDFPAALVEANLKNKWNSAAARLYKNWLAYLVAAKERHAADGRSREILPIPRFAAGA